MNQLAHIHSGVSEAPEQLDYYQGEAVELGECVMLEQIVYLCLLLH